MIIYEDLALQQSKPRTHPWTYGGTNQEFRYFDFKARPEIIREVLEDFRDHAEQPAVQLFYRFLAWINGAESHLETNDCAFRPPARHHDENSDKLLSCHGRVFLFYRELRYNLNLDACEWLKVSFFRVLSGLDREFRAPEGVVGLTPQPTMYSTIPYYSSADEIRGRQLMCSFWAYGDSSQECFRNLGRVFENLWNASRIVSDHIRDKFDHDALKAVQ
jgi:hypothetical protein